MKTENDFRAQADRIISSLPPSIYNQVLKSQNWKVLNRLFRQQLLNAYNQGVQDEAQRIAQGYDNDQQNDIF